MSQHRVQMQEVAIHLSQQISNAFGAAYCRVGLFPANAKFPEAANGVAAEIVTLALPQSSGKTNGQGLNGAPLARELKIAAPYTPEAEAASRIASAGRGLRPRLRFCWQGEEAGNEQGCLEVCFNAPRQFSAAEVSALLLMAEVARTILALTRLAALQATSAEQVAKKLQGDLFTMPFLEAKKIWIDAFEQEYLRQQMIKFFGNISKAARAARISRYTLYALLNKFQFSAQSFKRMKPQKSSLGRGATHNGRKKSEEREALPDMFAQLA